MVSQKRITAYPAWWLVLLLVWLIFCWDQVQISNLFMFELPYLFLVYNLNNNYVTFLYLFIKRSLCTSDNCFGCFVFGSFLFLKVVFKFLFPEHPFYLMMNSFLLQRPALDIRDLPLFYSMFNSSTMQVRSSQSLVTASVWTVPHYMKYLAKFHSREKATILLIYTEFKPTQIDPPRSNVGDMYCYWVACGQAQFAAFTFL